MTKDQRRIAVLEDKVARLQKHCLELQRQNAEYRHAHNKRFGILREVV